MGTTAWARPSPVLGKMATSSEAITSTLFHIVLTPPFQEGTLYLSFTDEGTKAQRGQVTCPKSHVCEIRQSPS